MVTAGAACGAVTVRIDPRDKSKGPAKGSRQHVLGVKMVERAGAAIDRLSDPTEGPVKDVARTIAGAACRSGIETTLVASGQAVDDAADAADATGATNMLPTIGLMPAAGRGKPPIEEAQATRKPGLSDRAREAFEYSTAGGVIGVTAAETSPTALNCTLERGTGKVTCTPGRGVS